MDWDKLKVFHAAAEAGTFTHAGERLGCRNRRYHVRFRRSKASYRSRSFTAMRVG